MLYPPEEFEDVERVCPRTRGDDGPCPFVSCRHHLYLDVQRTGSITLNFPDLEPWELEETCAIDVAIGGGATLERTGELLNCARERVRQIVDGHDEPELGRRDPGALARFRDSMRALGLENDLRPEPTRYRLPIVPSDTDLGEGDVAALRSALDAKFPPNRDRNPFRGWTINPGRQPSERTVAALALLDRQGCVSTIEIALAIDASRASTGEMMRRLRAAGHVERTSVPGVWRRKGSSAEPSEAHRRMWSETRLRIARAASAASHKSRATEDRMVSAELMGKCVETVVRQGPLSAVAIATSLNESVVTIRKALAQAKDDGKLEVSGIKKGSRWHLPGQPPAKLDAETSEADPKVIRKRSALVRLPKKAKGKVKAKAGRKPRLAEAIEHVAAPPRIVELRVRVALPAVMGDLARDFECVANALEQKAKAARDFVDGLGRVA